MLTVSVQQLNTYIVKMSWSNKVNDQDVRNSFKEINSLLSVSAQPMFVLVDITADPNFPIAATLTGALFGPYRNPNLREWLIVGSNKAAHFIERTLSGATGRTIVRWFDTEADAAAYVAESQELVA
jgi:TctA family transporter